jgi:hypothetical protein
VSAQWAAILLLSLIAAGNSVGTILLIRRLRQPLAAAAGGQAAARPGGPLPGTQVFVGAPVTALSDGADLVVFGFISPECELCKAMLPEFAALAGRERVVLVGAGGQDATAAYLAGRGIRLPLVTHPDVFDANDIPWPPYAVVTSRTGVVLAAGNTPRGDHLAALLGRARTLRHAARG